METIYIVYAFIYTRLHDKVLLNKHTFETNISDTELQGHLERILAYTVW